MSLQIKLRHEKRGEHVRTTVFARWYDGTDTTFHNLGTITSDIGQYQLLWAALGLGATQTHGDLELLPDTGWSPAKEGR